MKITMTYFFAINFLNELNKYSDITGKLALAISRTKNNLMNEIRIFNDERDKLVKKYGKEDDKGNFSVEPGDENFAAFTDEYIPLAETTFEGTIYQISQEDFDKANFNSDTLTVADYDRLMGFFVETPAVADNKTEEAV